MKKRVIPVIIAIVLIIFIVAISVGVKLMDKYSYSKERADLEEYFSIRSLDEVAAYLSAEKCHRFQLPKRRYVIYFFLKIILKLYFSIT